MSGCLDSIHSRTTDKKNRKPLASSMLMNISDNEHIRRRKQHAWIDQAEAVRVPVILQSYDHVREVR
jgi:hypothetical protein